MAFAIQWTGSLEPATTPGRPGRGERLAIEMFVKGFADVATVDSAEGAKAYIRHLNSPDAIQAMPTTFETRVISEPPLL